MIAVVLGLGMGLGLAIGLDQLDRSLKTIDAVELHLDTPVFGLMPKLHGKDFHFVLDSKEAVDVQRIASKLTRQLFRGIKQDRAGAIHRSKVIMITSSVMGEGKSTFSAYLSACFAEMLNSTSILLIDGDLRRGALHKIFKVDNSYGLGNLLEENEEYQPEVPCLQSTKHARLHVLTSGQSEESPVALFTSEKFSKMLEQLKKYYELIILDTPPVIPVNDAMILSRFADTILYVVKAGETPREIAQRGIGLVRTTESHLSGVVMNNMRSVLPYYYRHEYYKYQYEREPQDNSRQNGHDKNGAALKKHLAGDGGDGSEVKESDKSPEKLIAGDDENGIVSDNDKSSAGFIEGMQHAG
jgi:capsular exopolysaccharide synthesis family protein